MELSDIVRLGTGAANFAAGAYKGGMDAAGIDIDPAYLLYVIGGSAALKGITASIKQHIDSRDFGKKMMPMAMESNEIKIESPIHKVARETGNDLALNAAELAAGYAAGYSAVKYLLNK